MIFSNFCLNDSLSGIKNICGEIKAQNYINVAYPEDRESRQNSSQ